MSDELIVTTKHLYSVPTWTARVGFCASKSREWFAAHNLSWSEFVFNGIPASKLEATNDALALAVVKHARNMESANGQQ